MLAVTAYKLRVEDPLLKPVNKYLKKRYAEDVRKAFEKIVGKRPWRIEVFEPDYY